MKHLIRSLLLAVLALYMAPANATPARAPKFAVLVGITDYRQPNVPKLQGCLNDVRDMKAKLVGDFGFDPRNILVVENKAATHAGIVAAIRAGLRDKAKQHPDGTFLFYFSGHGSQEQLGTDKPDDPEHETLVTYDTDLINDDLGLLCREVRGVKGFTGSLTVILDSCHSFRATREPDKAGAPHVRSAPPDPKRLARPLKEQAPLEGDPTAGKFAAFSGCLSTQTSEEKEFPVAAPVGAKTPERNEYHGVLTYFLLRFMGAATNATTNSELWTQVAGVMSGRYDQQPQLEGGETHDPFLGGSNKSDVPSVPYTLTDDTLTFPQGIEEGALPGGFVAVINDGKTQGQLAITSAKLGQASATVPPTLHLAPTGEVRLLTPYFGNEPLRVGIGAGITATNSVVKRLKQHYSGDNAQFVRLATPAEMAAFKSDVYIERGNNKAGTGGFYCVATAPSAEPIFGVQLPATKGAGGGDISAHDELRLFETLDNYATQRNVKSLSNQMQGGVSAKQAVAVTVVSMHGVVDANGNWHTDKANPVLRPVDLSKDTLAINDGIRFEFQNQTSKPLNVAVLWLSQDGSITALGDADGRKVFGLKPSGQPESSAQTSNYGISPPVGTESIKVFVSTNPMNVYYLERDAIRKNVPPGPVSPFDMIAGEAFGTRAPRRDDDQPEFNSWDTEAMTLTIGK